MFRYSNLIMIALYIFVGAFLLIAGWDLFDKWQNIGVGLLLLIYGLFRGYRLFVQFMKDQRPDSTSE